MALPVTIPNTFATATSAIPLSQLDANFNTLANVINDINSGAQVLANLKASNVEITGGIISNVTLDNVTVDVETLSNVTINGGNVTVTNMVATTANATTGNITTLNATTGNVTQVIVGAGAVGNAAVTTTGDTNTGIFFPAADTIAFTEGGVEAMRIDSSGNVGIGTSSPITKLQVTSSAVRVTAESTTNSSNAGYRWSVKDSNGNVGNSGIYVEPTSSIGNRYFGFSVDDTTFAMVLNNSGNLGLGVVPVAYNTNARVLHIDGGANQAELRLTNNTTGTSASNGGLLEQSGNDLYFWNIENSFLSFGTNNTERARITSGGYFKASNAGTYNNVAATYHEFYNNDNNAVLLLKSENNSMTSDAFVVIASRNTTDNTFYAINYYNNGASAYKFRVADSGNVTNTNGTYGTISDAKLKQDIVDASSQWDDIKSLRFRKYRLKSEVELDPNAKPFLGLVAQEAELVSPGLIEEHIDRDQEGNDLGTTTKSIKTSILYMKAVKALQEAMERIETLEAEVQALKSK